MDPLDHYEDRDDERDDPPATKSQAQPYRAGQDPLPPLFNFNSINILGGANSSGKTPLLAWLIEQFIDGGPVLGHTIPKEHLPLRHFVLCADRSWLTSTRKTFSRVVDRVIAYCPYDDPSFDTQKFRRAAERLEIFETCLEKLRVAPGSLLWVDPLSTFTGVAPLNPDSYLIAYSELRSIVKRRGITMIGTVPGVKPTVEQKYLRPQDRIAGSFAQMSYADTLMFLTTPTEQHRKVYTLNVVPRQAPAQNFDLTWAVDTFKYALPVDEFAELLPMIPVFPGKIAVADLSGMLTPNILSRATLFNYLKELKRQGVIKLVERGVYSRVQPY